MYLLIATETFWKTLIHVIIFTYSVFFLHKGLFNKKYISEKIKNAKKSLAA